MRVCGAERGTERRTRRARSRHRRVGGAAQPERKRIGAAAVPYRCVGCRPEQSGHQHQLSSRRPWRRMIIIAGIDTTGNSKRRTGFSFLFCGEQSNPGGVRPAIRLRHGRKTACKIALGVVAWPQCVLAQRAAQGRRSFCQALKRRHTVGIERGKGRSRDHSRWSRPRERPWGVECKSDVKSARHPATPPLWRNCGEACDPLAAMEHGRYAHPSSTT